MKKTLLGLFLVLGAASFASQHKVEVKGAYDIAGEYKLKYNNQSEDLKAKRNAGEIGAEYRYEVTPGLEIGGGTAYQFHKDIKDNGVESEAYNSVPVYATAKYTFDTPTTVKPYVKGDLGYSINTDKAKDGVYYGVGGGISYNNFNAEVMYKENQGKYEVKKSDDIKANYKRVSLGVGYNFDLLGK